MKTKAEQFIEDNIKIITVIVLAIVLAIACFNFNIEIRQKYRDYKNETEHVEERMDTLSNMCEPGQGDGMVQIVCE